MGQGWGLLALQGQRPDRNPCPQCAAVPCPIATRLQPLPNGNPVAVAGWLPIQPRRCCNWVAITYGLQVYPAPYCNWVAITARLQIQPNCICIAIAFATQLQIQPGCKCKILANTTGLQMHRRCNNAGPDWRFYNFFFLIFASRAYVYGGLSIP